MSPTVRGVIHIVAGGGGVIVAAAVFPAPWNEIVGALVAGIVAAAAFLDQSISKNQ